ncbi:MAG: uracil-DNA glycosylase [Campylobacter sp.]|uniref:uracil-DNA glycosylase n=1 Tax=Campylobacter sp. TaxID=205 RepID=UPI001B7BCB11|nr:uracil-DNA glycosylase [Campylobacter sp.]MBP3676570.1 uracil-DNA glycosylase [Campylobacter sp.]
MYSNLISYLDPEWQELLKDELNSLNFAKIISFLNSQNTTIYPPKELIFNAFNLCKPSDLKVIIIGQDPYHNAGEAMGLAFSVPSDVKTPPSLKNIFKELFDDLDCDIFTNRSSDLTSWANQGVLLLNTALTVEQNRPASHSKIGWQIFTAGVIRVINAKFDHCVFMLWGNHAKNFASLIDSNRHMILKTAHPSPLARGAFFGSRHFSQCNAYLLAHGKALIDWLS